MGFFGKLIAGGLGWSFAGPIGAIIGVAIASIIDKKQEGHNTYTYDYAHGRDSSYNSHKSTSNDFQVALLVLMAAVMKADGKIVKGELAVVKKFLVANYGEEGALEALQVLKELLNQNIDYESVSIQCGAHLNYSVKLQLINMLYEIAAGDNELAQSEIKIIKQIARYMRVSEADASSIGAMYAKQSNKDWAYQVLEVSPNCSDDELKKAYRRMAMKYHPDKVNTLGEDVKRDATEKFRKVKEAYDEIKKQRGI